MILRNNPELLEKYDLAPMSLYILDTEQSTNIKVQEDYNQLHRDYKYHHILAKDSIPFGILFANPQYIKHLEVYGRKIFIENNNSGKTL
jgi:hypothetical protein